MRAIKTAALMAAMAAGMLAAPSEPQRRVGKFRELYDPPMPDLEPVFADMWDTGPPVKHPRPTGMTGPVIDTTPETKRAKRRRLARERGEG